MPSPPQFLASDGSRLLSSPLYQLPFHTAKKLQTPPFDFSFILYLSHPAGRLQNSGEKIMSAFDYPLEPLALNYLNFGFLTSVNCVWTWVVVLTTTAAVSVLAAIRASSTPRGKSPDEPSSGRYQSPPAPESILEKLPNPSTQPEPDPVHSSIKSSSPSADSMLSLDTVGRTSGKFSLYYNQKEDDDDCGENDDDVKINGCDNCDNEGADGEVLYWVGATLKMKMKGIGLYQCQDLRVLDGSVVRLWDGCRRRNPVNPVVTCGGAGVVTW